MGDADGCLYTCQTFAQFCLTLLNHAYFRAEVCARLLKFCSQPLKLRSQPMKFGSQPMKFGSQPMKFGSQPMKFGSQPMKFGSQPMKFGSQLLNFGSQLLSVVPLPRGMCQHQAAECHQQRDAGADDGPGFLAHD